MDKFIARLNIDHFREQLASEVGEQKRQMLLGLLAKEEDTLATLEGRSKKKV